MLFEILLLAANSGLSFLLLPTEKTRAGDGAVDRPERPAAMLKPSECCSENGCHC